MYTQKLLLPALLAIVSVGSSSVSQAAVLVDYAFTGSSAATISSATPTSVAANVTSSLTKSGNSATKLSIDTVAGWSTQPFLRAETINPTFYSTAASAVANNNYFAFTLTASPGYELDLSSLTFVVTNGGSAGPRGLAIQNSVTGFSTDGSTNLELTAGSGTITSTGAISAGDSQDILTNRGTPSTFTNFTMDLSGTNYQDLSSITFRIYFYTSTHSQSVEFDNIDINGSVVAVPEPSAAASLLAGGLSVLVLRRRIRTV